MKKLFLFLLFITGITNAQIVNIPDANFKAKLLSTVVGKYETNPNDIIDTNHDGEIQESEALNVTHLDVSDSNISDLTGIKSFANLTYLWCLQNQITSLDVTTLTKLTALNCCFNKLTSLDVTPLINLTYLSCGGNQLTSLDVTPLVNLNNLFCGSNKLTSLDVTLLVNLTGLECSANQLTSLDVTPLLNLTALNCPSNQFTSLDLSPLVKLKSLWCNDNPLEKLILKNNSNETFLQIGPNPNLKFICADEFQIDAIQQNLNGAGMTNTLVNSYCSFTPGGDYNTVSGRIYFDSDANGCDANDLVLDNLKININDGVTTETAFENDLGEYKFYVQKPNITLTLTPENPSFFTISPSSATFTFPTNNNSTQTQDFCVTANGEYNDVEVAVVPVTQARPGFKAVYQIAYKNKGSQTISGNIDFVYNDSVLDYVSATVSPNSQNSGNISWTYSNLLPFESKSFMITLKVNTPTETPAVNIGDILSFIATINPVSGDENLSDNNFAIRQTVVGSFDPNDITCLEGEAVSPTKIGEYLHYNVNFENTGTFAAENIVVKDIVDTTKFDIGSLQIMNSSHPVTTRIADNKLEFIFENINLEANQHGNVVFKIKTKNTLVTGNTVAHKADIYFDYNAPVATNTASTTFQALSNDEFVVDDSIAVYPNPTKNNININCSNTINSIQLFDIQGRVLVTKTVDDSHADFDISNYSKGVYFLKITTVKGMKIEKIIKE